jgi:hypothetical protein
VPALLIVKNPHLADDGEALVGALSKYSLRWLRNSCKSGCYKPYLFVASSSCCPELKEPYTEKRWERRRSKGNCIESRNVPGRYPTFALIPKPYA